MPTTKQDRRLELWIAAVALIIGLGAAFLFARKHVTAPAEGAGVTLPLKQDAAPR